jgi:hypothetical protein
MTAITASIVSVVVGAVLASLLIVVGVTALSPSAKQSDAPLIVYGQDQ